MPRPITTLSTQPTHCQLRRQLPAMKTGKGKGIAGWETSLQAWTMTRPSRNLIWLSPTTLRKMRPKCLGISLQQLVRTKSSSWIKTQACLLILTWNIIFATLTSMHISICWYQRADLVWISAWMQCNCSPSCANIDSGDHLFDLISSNLDCLSSCLKWCRSKFCVGTKFVKSWTCTVKTQSSSYSVPFV